MVAGSLPAVFILAVRSRDKVALQWHGSMTLAARSRTATLNERHTDLLAALSLGDDVLRFAAYFLRLNSSHDALSALTDALLSLLFECGLGRRIVLHSG